MKKGFTLVELVITIAIVIILSVVSIPIYRGYVNKAMMAEGYALLGTLFSAQKAYYSEYGNFFMGVTGGFTVYDPVLGVDARGNKYFSEFDDNAWGDVAKIYTHVFAKAPEGLLPSGDTILILEYNVTRGTTIHEYPSIDWHRSGSW